MKLLIEKIMDSVSTITALSDKLTELNPEEEQILSGQYDYKGLFDFIGPWIFDMDKEYRYIHDAKDRESYKQTYYRQITLVTQHFNDILSTEEYYEELESNEIESLENALFILRDKASLFYSDAINFEKGIISDQISNVENAICIFIYADLGDTYTTNVEWKENDEISNKKIAQFFFVPDLKVCLKGIDDVGFWSYVYNNQRGKLDLFGKFSSKQIVLEMGRIKKILSSDALLRYDNIRFILEDLLMKIEEASELLLN
ncbi:hypothetical protein [Flammeovirga sp. SubArs3]|uniref:hypothetical protein n=1 Tax=Flammeovirga sp. SubArs3 TaxID=2995316 RepID=UPI00248AEA89|nr:hypothetical protein [Flammeovirga sp. SubArs3]